MSVPQAIIDEATNVAASLLPEKSSARYEHEYAEFKKWQNENNVTGITEDVLLAYISNLSKKFSLNSLWSKWSMVKSCLFHKVIAFLKRRNERYVPKKAKTPSKTLTKEHVEKFILEAPDDKWLLAKVITIFGIFGCYRCDELLSLTLNDVEDLEKYIVVTLRETKNLTTMRFTITDDGCSFKPCVIYRKYAALRPHRSKDLRLFLTYRNGKCVALNAGQHTVGTVYLKRLLNI
ncbi:hypothetical protein PPYR_03919 [Photinus pyralis]|uniref:Tyr recombinase domain-containing protein n=1 Tax=Photinus pyralis TaxID=7054 RepID=A0A5N4AWT3_PHOPY|nr:hypothetical protein PPYR_03919 [Photinus pyralis]